jgi:class 3 adenylate cyclase/pimeloyl-ACP methyl ester carboxylesterase
MTEESDQRQLLAIMFTDVVGYTALTERDESAALRVREQHRELLATLVGQFDGEVVDATGDESFSVFPSALRAVDCALALQGALRSYPDLRLRIGIHLGDVLRRDGEVIGEGVNVAARVRPLAEPGGIAVSEPVYQMVRTRAHVVAESIGSQRFKNVGEAVEVFALESADGGPSRSKGRSKGRSRRWIAVAALGLTTLLLAVGLYPPTRDSAMSWALLRFPLLVGESMQQEIGFARNPSDGVQLAYAVTGEGPAILAFLGWATHVQEGLGSTLYDPDGLVPLSSHRNRFVRIDGRGFGLSDRDVNDFSLEASVGDLRAVIDALGEEKVGLYTYSSGGPTAIAFAARHPERVSGLVLASTFGSPFMSEEQQEAQQRIRAIIAADWEKPFAANLIVDRRRQSDRRPPRTRGRRGHTANDGGVPPAIVRRPLDRGVLRGDLHPRRAGSGASDLRTDARVARCGRRGRARRGGQAAGRTDSRCPLRAGRGGPPPRHRRNARNAGDHPRLLQRRTRLGSRLGVPGVARRVSIEVPEGRGWTPIHVIQQLLLGVDGATLIRCASCRLLGRRLAAYLRVGRREAIG